MMGFWMFSVLGLCVLFTNMQLLSTEVVQAGTNRALEASEHPTAQNKLTWEQEIKNVTDNIHQSYDHKYNKYNTISQLFIGLNRTDAIKSLLLVDRFASWVQGIDIPGVIRTMVAGAKPERQRQIFDTLKHVTDLGYSMSSGHLVRHAAAVNISAPCRESLNFFVDGLLNQQVYAWKYIDALGKPGAGITDGNVQWLGSYDQCRGIKKTYNKNDTQLGHSVHVDGKYCLVELEMKAQLTPQLGICVPSTCEASDFIAIIEAVKKLILPKYSDIIEPTIHCKESATMQTSTYIFIGFCSIGLLLLIVGSSYDVISTRSSQPFTSLTDVSDDADDGNQHKSDEEQKKGFHSSDLDVKYQAGNNTSKFRELLLSFSGLSNGSKILSTSARGGDSFLAALNGIRVISMWWVVFGHSISLQIMFISNIAVVPNLLKRFTFQAVLQAPFSVDSFFFLSGLLVCYMTLKHLDSAKSMNWFLFYFHRFWRLAPLYMFVLLFYMGIVGFVSDGPWAAYFADHTAYRACTTYWWSNVLYINNLIPGDLDHQCMGWTWYLANDMQFYILSPLIIYPLYRWRRVGLCTILTLLAASLTVSGLVAREHHISPVTTNYTVSDDDKDYDTYLYIQPQYRIPPYLVGMLTGYIFFKTRGNCKLPKFLPAIGWCVSTVLGMLLIYGFYGNYKHSKPLSPGVGAWYVSCGRCSWGVVLSWICFACGHGYGGAINKFLSWPAWSPLSRLTYAVYLVHPIVMMLYYVQIRQPMYYTDSSTAYICIGNLVVSYGVSFIISVMIESPMMAIEKVLLKKWR